MHSAEVAMGKKRWVYLYDDDDRGEWWLNVDTSEVKVFERDGEPLSSIPAKRVSQVPVQGPPK